MKFVKVSTAMGLSVATTVAAMVLASGVHAQANAPDYARIIASGRMATLDLAGVRLGMTPGEVEAALLRSGYKLNGKQSTGSSYQQKVQTALRERISTTPYVSSTDKRTLTSLDADGPNDEYLLVDFAPMPDGARVHSVSVSFKGERTTPAMLAQDVAKKFGPSSVDQPLKFSSFWCGSNDQTCGKIVGYNEPHLRFWYFIKPGQLDLKATEPVNRWLSHAVASEVDRKAPKRSSTF